MKITLSSIGIGTVLSLLSPTPARGTVVKTKAPDGNSPQAMLQNGKMAPVKLGAIMLDFSHPIDPNPVSPIVETTEHLHLGAQWTNCGFKTCTSYKFADYKCYLKGARNWEYDAVNTQVTINGKVFNGCTWQRKTWTGMYGGFKDVPDESCAGKWGSFRYDGCSGGVACYSSIIEGLQEGWDWYTMCLNQPAVNPGQWDGEIKPIWCKKDGLGKWWGKFEVSRKKCL